MAAVKFYFRCLVIVLFILFVNARNFKYTNHQSYPPSHGLSGQASKNSYHNPSGLSRDKTNQQLYPVSCGLSGSGRPSSPYPGSSGLSGTGSGTRKPEPTYPPSVGLSGNSYPPSHGLSGQASKNSHRNPSGLSGDKTNQQLYPVSGGLSGSDRPSSSYPGSSDLSGTGSGTRKPEPSYPPSVSLSGNSYPPSHGLSGQASKNSHRNPSGLSGDKTNQQLYPVSGGLSGSDRPSSSYPGSSGLSGTGSGTRKPEPSYPPSNGLSGNLPSTGSGYPHPKVIYPVVKSTQKAKEYKVHHHHTHTHTVVHHNYVYKPPPNILYTPAYGMSAVSYPVYTGSQVPFYVYKYRSSENKYKMLLAGLALYNLGMVSANPSIYNYHKHYAVRSDEVCKFGVRYEYGSYEEMVIDCRAITNFIWEDQSKPKASQQVIGQTIVTTNVQTQTLLPNGTLSYPGFGANTTLSSNGTLLNTTNVIFITNTTVSDSKYNGNKVAVSSDMECYILRYTSYSNMRKTVPCELLKIYAEQSLRNYVVTIKSPAPWILLIMTVALRIAF